MAPARENVVIVWPWYSQELRQSCDPAMTGSLRFLQERIAPLLAGFYRGRYDVDRCCAFGPPAEWAAFIRRFLDAGITTVMLCMARPDVEQLDRLHREVEPLLK